MLIFKDRFLGFQDLPKNASTSMFAWLFEVIYGFSHRSDEAQGMDAAHIHRFFREADDKTINVELEDLGGYDLSDHYCFALTRDPITRFLSMYSNRIGFHRELSEEAAGADRLRAAGLPFDPDINTLVAHLDRYMARVGSIHHHTRPMVEFLGEDLSLYTRIVDVSQINTVISEIKDMWKSRGFNKLVENSPNEAPRLQTGGQKIGLEVLTPASFELLMDYYAKDYDILPTLDRQATEDAFAAARAKHGDTRIPPPGAFFGNAIHCPTRLKREKPLANVIDRLWIDKLPETVTPGERVRVRGALALRTDIDQLGYKIIVRDRYGPREAVWGGKSPGLSKTIPENPNAVRGRFRIAGVVMDENRPVFVSLQSPGGQEWPLFKIFAALPGAKPAKPAKPASSGSSDRADPADA